MKRYLAELFGTFVLVFGGVGSAVLAGDKIGYLGVSLAFGLSLLAMIYTIGHISGCHLNPAVTLGMFVSNKMDRRLLPGYIVAQVIGAILASGLILLIAQGGPQGYQPSIAGLGANGFAEHSPGNYNLLSAFLAETILTFFLVLTILGATDIKAPVGFAGIAIGLVLTLIHLVGIPITNTSVNPARSIGPAIFVGGQAINQLWLFIVAPMIGAVIASGVYKLIGAAAPQISVKQAEQALDSQQVEREDREAEKRDLRKVS